jgi:hypothetical protein
MHTARACMHVIDRAVLVDPVYCMLSGYNELFKREIMCKAFAPPRLLDDTDLTR